MGSANRTSCTSCTEACRRGLQGRVCGISLWPSNSPKVQWRHLVSFYVFINCNALPSLKQKSNKTLLKKKKCFIDIPSFSGSTPPSQLLLLSSPTSFSKFPRDSLHPFSTELVRDMDLYSSTQPPLSIASPSGTVTSGLA